MLPMIKVFGHISPDTDTTCSAIVWSWYLNNHDSKDSKPYVLGKLNKETLFVLKHWKIEQPELLESVNAEDQIVIVDTNNPQELLPNISDADIIQIIDHHKLAGGLTTNKPLEMTLKTVATTATIIYDLMGDIVDSLPENISGLLLSCILSDTLAFRSPTTTPNDKEIAEKLAARLGITINTYADQMFAAKSDLSDISEKEILVIDSKKFKVGDKNIRVSVVETTTPQAILDRKASLVAAFQSIITEDGDTDDLLFFIVDILKEESTVLTYNQFTKELIHSSFGVPVTTDTVILPGVVSRKKQIIPVLKLPTA
jgi:manganese-dependent inorganic pyrophosphatase